MRDSEALALIAQAEKDLALIKNRWKPARTNHHNRADRFSAGYPTGSGSAGARSGVSDPTGQLIERRANRGFPHDLLGLELDEAENSLRDIVKLSADLVNFVRRFTDMPPDGQAPEDCQSCALVGFTSIVYAQGRCEFHWRFWKAHDETDLHPELSRLHCQGRRLTQNMVDHYHGTMIKPV